MFNRTWYNLSRSTSCENKANILRWKTCHENALDQQMIGINRKIKMASFTLMVIGIVSSSLVCMVVLRIRRIPQRTISNVLILNLALADILFRFVYVITRVILPTLDIKISSGSVECKIMLYSHNACAAVTFALLAGIAIDRYQQIVHPLKYFYMARARRIVVILSLWIYACVVAVGFIFVGEDRPYEKSTKLPKKFRRYNNTIRNTVTYRTKKVKYCSLGKKSFSSQLAFTPYFVFGFLIPLCIITVTYAAVFRFLKARSQHNISRSSALKSKRKALKMLVVVVASFVVCWAPVMLVDLFRVYGLKFGRSFSVRQIAESFSHLSSIISPVLYAFGNSNFRIELNKMLQELKVILSR